MPLSMTAWGFSKDKYYSINIRSLNSKYKEINLHLPQEFFSLEPLVYSLINSKITRGKIDVFINVNEEKNTTIKINEKLFKNAYIKFKNLFKKTGIKDEIPLDVLIQNIDGIINKQQTETKEIYNWQKIKNLFLKALNNLFLMKKIEGEKLASDIKSKAKKIEKELKKISKDYIMFKKEYTNSIKQKIKEIFNQDELVINKEVIQILDKFDINEELVRLSSHISQIIQLIKGKGVIGKKIDFLTQEINRESNTILSKISYLEITKSVINIKELNDKIREQIQNLE